VGAIELTRTLLAAPTSKLDGLELGPVRRDPDDLPTTITEETFELGCTGFGLEGLIHLDISI
jgi:hypothetical protein